MNASKHEITRGTGRYPKHVSYKHISDVDNYVPACAQFETCLVRTLPAVVWDEAGQIISRLTSRTCLEVVMALDECDNHLTVEC